jgi:hypothetical protein
VGRAIAQVLSRRLPTAATQVRAQVRSRGICGRQSGTEAKFLRVLQFPLPIIIPQTAPHSSSIVWAGTTGHLVADVSSRLCLAVENCEYCMMTRSCLLNVRWEERRKHTVT